MLNCRHSIHRIWFSFSAFAFATCSLCTSFTHRPDFVIKYTSTVSICRIRGIVFKLNWVLTVDTAAERKAISSRGNSRKPHKRKSNFDCSVFILHLFFFFFCVCRLETRYLCTSPQDKHIFSNNFAHLPWLDIWYALKACDTLFSLFSACEYESLVL